MQWLEGPIVNQEVPNSSIGVAVIYVPVCLCNAFLDLPTLSMMTDILSFMSYCRLALPTLEGYQLLVYIICCALELFLIQEKLVRLKLIKDWILKNQLSTR